MNRPFLFAAGLALPALLAGGLAVAAPHRLVLDPQSSELTFLLDTTLHEVHGTLHLDAGEVRFDTATGEADGEIVLDAARTETGNAKRDKKMHGRVLESERFPRIVFRPARVEGQLADSGHSELEVIGTISIHGAEHPLTLPVVVERRNDRLIATTDFSVPYVSWGMDNPSLLFLRVSKEVEVTIRAEGRLQPETTAISSARTP